MKRQCQYIYIPIIITYLFIQGFLFSLVVVGNNLLYVGYVKRVVIFSSTNEDKDLNINVCIMYT